MIARLARFANDSYYLLRTPHATAKKAALWFNLLHPSAKMLGLDIAHFDGPALKHLYRDIFARQHYYFRANTHSPVILDCGANIGMATLYFKWLYPKARIEAFEPDPDAFALLETNIARNHLNNVVAHNCALWDENGQIEFFVDHANPGSLLMSADASRLKGEAIQVPSRKLSEFIQGPIDFLKLDVEGAENRIVSDLISEGRIHYIRQMVIEYHHHMSNQRSCLADFLRQLEEAGFEYQLHASLWPVTSQGVFQDVLIGAYRDEVLEK
jgi:FkbM family methyltransferase